MRVTLRVTAGPHEGREFVFTGHDTFMVGRSQRAHFRLATKDRYFSRFHFLVEANPPQCRLLDMGSRNGTRVNGAKVKQADLRDGDEIRAGRTVLRVTVEAPADGPPVVEPEPVAPGEEGAAAALPWASVHTVFPRPATAPPHRPRRRRKAARAPRAPPPFPFTAPSRRTTAGPRAVRCCARRATALRGNCSSAFPATGW